MIRDLMMTDSAQRAGGPDAKPTRPEPPRFVQTNGSHFCEIYGNIVRDTYQECDAEQMVHFLGNSNKDVKARAESQ